VIRDSDATLTPSSRREICQMRAGTGAKFFVTPASMGGLAISPNFILCRINPESAYQNARNLCPVLGVNLE
jgi:hypothetical protein